MSAPKGTLVLMSVSPSKVPLESWELAVTSGLSESLVGGQLFRANTVHPVEVGLNETMSAA